MSSDILPWPATLVAPASWQAIDFISDLHLQASEPQTVQTLRDYLHTCTADALFILGDLFEVWVGDDCLEPPTTAVFAARSSEPSPEPSHFEQQCASLLHAAAQRMPIYIMHGNRDFLLGSKALEACSATALADPTLLQFAGLQCLLSHGDALCLADIAYMAFRAQVRSPAWQSTFLAKPLAERQALARAMRAQSEALKRTGQTYADVDANLARQWLAAAGCNTLIHGHTHKPAEHALGQGLRRMVLSDWDCATQPPRAQLLRWSSQGLQRLALV